jgi:mannosyltransferase
MLRDTTASTRSRAASAALLAVPTLVAAILVLYGIGRESLWRDEVASVTITGRSLGSMWHVIVHHESNMALFDLLLAPWQRLGHGDGFLRLPSAAFAIATVPVTMLVARRLAGDVAAAVAGAVVALNGFVVVFGQQVRGYALTMLLAALAALLLLRALESGRRRDWALWTLTIAALPYAHLLGVLIVVAQVASLALYPWRRLPVRPLAASLAAAGVLWLPIASFIANGDTNRTSWVQPLGLDLLRQSVEALAGDLGMFLILVVAALVVFGGLVAALRRDGRLALSEEAWRLALPLCWVAIPPFLLGVICVAQETWVDRYLIGIVPAFGVLAGVAVTVLRARFGTVAAGVLAAVLLAGALVAAAGEPHPSSQGEDLRGAAAYVSAQTRPGDALVYAPAFARVGLSYYLGREGGPRPADLALRESAVAAGDLFGRELPAAEVARRMRAAPRLWVLGYGVQDGGPNAWHPTPEPVMAVAPAILREDFVPAGSRDFGAFTVQLYRHR